MVAHPIMSIGQAIALACGDNPTKINGSKKTPPLIAANI
jgi:hypothetical protein